MDKENRKWLRALKHIECCHHQPFVKMKKSPKFFGWVCPECRNEMGELWRKYQLNKLKTCNK